MLIGNSAIQQFVSKAVSHTHYATPDTDAYTSAMAGAATPVAAIASNGEGAAQSGNDGKQGYDESFAKMMVNLKAAAANTRRLTASARPSPMIWRPVMARRVLTAWVL